MTAAITVTGLVQGVGYRPFVAELAEELELTGEVKNAGGIVTITVSGAEQALELFIQRLSSSAPKGAVVKRVQVERLPEDGTGSPFKRFSIRESVDIADEMRLLPPDLAICPDCERELRDPSNRRYRHPFISCTSCGPRFSIMERVPYDRDTITMRAFPMCAECGAEYRAKGGRRRHAQTIACRECGPCLKAIVRVNDKGDAGALAQAVQLLREGGIIAVKDIGGFHFAFRPDCEAAARRLREFKNRDKKPFAVMFPDMEQVREYCEVDVAEEELLLSNPRPIVLLNKREDQPQAGASGDGEAGRMRRFAPSVCADSDRIGAMLPCNPLQILLLGELGPLVMTSGNRGGEPIIIEDADMQELLKSGCPDLMLSHDRKILTPLEDSVCQVSEVGASILRRGRGCVPEPVRMERSLSEDSFAAGGDLKAVFALGKRNMAYLSSPFGDLEGYRCMAAREASAGHMAKLLNVRPKHMARDLHPGYRSGREKPFEEIPVQGIQHHHAHILSVMAEHGLEGPLLGVAFDGTGYGTDGSIWGGEFLLCSRNQMERVAQLAPVKMAGGDAAAKDAAVSLWCYLLAARERGLLSVEELAQARSLACFLQRDDTCDTIAAALAQNIQTYGCSSMGRLFDAVSALLGICNFNSYEGECAIMLEQEAQRAARRIGQSSNQMVCSGGREEKHKLQMVAQPSPSGQVLDSVRLIVDLLHERQRGTAVSELAFAYHCAIVHATVEMCVKLREERGVSKAALSGGCFCNRILLDGTVAALKADGFRVYRNEAVPCGDGGIALGQLYALTFGTEASSP